MSYRTYPGVSTTMENIHSKLTDILKWLACFFFLIFFLMIRRPPRSTLDRSSAASDVYKRQVQADGGADHYMGYLVLQSTDNKIFDVIEGQQRLTTLMLIILAALKNLTRLIAENNNCLLYTSPSPRDRTRSRMPSSAWKKKTKKTHTTIHLYI